MALSTSPRKRDSGYHHGDLRNALIKAGLQILRSDGAHKLSLRETARIAGVSQAAPYRHFTNKEALLAAIAQQGFMLFGERLSAVTDASPDARELLGSISEAYARLAIEHKDHFRLMFNSVPPIEFKKYPELEQAARQLFEQFVRMVERCKQHKLIQANDPRHVALVLWSSFHGMTSLFVNTVLEFPSGGPELLGTTLRAMVRDLVDGLRSG
jgi:AcrR family transcriptional regulator